MTEYLSPPLEPSPISLLRLFEEAMEASVEGWRPKPAQLDERVAGAISFIASQLTEAASDGATDVFRTYGAKIRSIPPHEAIQATGITTWTATDTLGHLNIPAGVRVIWLDSFGNRQVFETIETFSIKAGESTNTNVPMRAVLGGTAGNGISGSAIELVNPLGFIASVVFNTPTSQGEEEESDISYLTRLVEAMQLDSPKPIKASDFSKWLLQRSGVGRVTSIRGFNPAGTVKDKAKLTNLSAELTGLKESTTERLVVGTKVSGVGIPVNTQVNAVGKTTVVLSNAATETKENELTFTEVKGEGGFGASWVGNALGEALSSERMKELETELAEELLAGVVWKILAPTFTTINVELTVFAWPGQTKQFVKEAVEAQLKGYFSGERWGAPPTGQTKEWNNDPIVRLVNTEHAVLQVVGTHYVKELKLNGAAVDVPMSGVVALPKLGTLAVTVEIG